MSYKYEGMGCSKRNYQRVCQEHCQSVYMGPRRPEECWSRHAFHSELIAQSAILKFIEVGEKKDRLSEQPFYDMFRGSHGSPSLVRKRSKVGKGT